MEEFKGLTPEAWKFEIEIPGNVILSSIWETGEQVLILLYFSDN